MTNKLVSFLKRLTHRELSFSDRMKTRGAVQETKNILGGFRKIITYNRVDGNPVVTIEEQSRTFKNVILSSFYTTEKRVYSYTFFGDLKEKDQQYFRPDGTPEGSSHTTYDTPGSWIGRTSRRNSQLENNVVITPIH